MLRITMLSLALLALLPVTPQGCPLLDGTSDDGGQTERGTIATQATASATQAAVGETVRLTATVDSSDTTLSYSWLQTAGTGVAIARSAKSDASFDAPSVEQDQALQFMVTTRNSLGDVGQASVRVTVTADPNYGQPSYDFGDTTNGTGPEADAGENENALPGDEMTLDASDSTGTGLSYHWRQLSGRTVELDSAGSQTTTFTAPAYEPNGDNECVFQLRVTDSGGRTDSDQVTVSVLSPTAVGPRVKLVTTFGTVILELYPEEAPKTVENFLDYVDEGFYENTIFHRVIPGFVVQGGGFTSNLREKKTNDPVENEADNGLSNVRGTIAMARTSDPDSATSQFFINLANNVDGGDGASDLDPGGVSTEGYTVFGRVFAGMGVFDRIAEVPTETRDGYQDVPVSTVLIESATLLDD